MKITINREIDTAVYIQIFQQIRKQILEGEIVPGYRLPAERKLAEHLLVNRTTVLNAYRELKAEGLVASQIGYGTVVLSASQKEVEDYSESMEPIWNQLLSQYTERTNSYLVKELLELANRTDVISFATGMADPENGPIEILEGIEKDLAAEKDYRPFLHTPTEGFLSLRKEICHLMQKRGVYCRPEEVMMLSGSQQGIDLAARVFLDPGDLVVVEEPTYFPALQVFRTAGARIMSVSVDSGGMVVDLLEQMLQRYRPKFIYTIPTFQNPTGTNLKLERRKQMVALAVKYNVMILEDDAYGDLSFDGDLPPMLKTMDRSGHVIYLSTFSKNIYSGLRVGWIVANKKVIREFASAKQLMDLHSSSLSQWIIERYLVSGAFDIHLKKICEEYKERRDRMCLALEQYAPEGVSWNIPEGGYYVWCQLPEEIDASGLVAEAARYKVSFVPGPPFFATGNGEHYIRLNFTFAAIGEIEEGIRRLCEAMRKMILKSDHAEKKMISEIKPIV